MKRWGIFIVIGALVLAFSFSGCGGGGGGGGGDLIIIASVSFDDDTGTAGAATIYEGGLPFFGGTPVTNATVTIAGTNIPHLGIGIYQASLSDFNAGDSIDLEVQSGGSTYTATVTMPYQPAVSAPTGDNDSTGPIDVVWTIGGTPDGYEIEVYYAADKGTVEYEGDDLGSAVTHTIPGGELPAGKSGLVAGVAAINAVAISGLDGVSGFYAQSLGESLSFNTL